MPKRDPSYMAAQRLLIARATLECMLEKGMYETSIRDICVRAGVSNGAFYTHFENRQDAVIAACTLDHEEGELPRVGTWDQFVQWVRASLELVDEEPLRKRYRLSHQLLAELTQETGSRADITRLYGLAGAGVGEVIANLHARGEIDPPLDIGTTQSLCMRLIFGSFQALMMNAALDRARAADELVDGLALLVQPRAKGGQPGPASRGPAKVEPLRRP